MKKRVIISLIALMLLVIAVFIRFYKIDFLHGEIYLVRRMTHNSNYSEERIEKSNLIIMISNQSYENDKVDIKGYIDSELLFNDKYLVGNQHLVSYYYKNLSTGKHVLEVEAKDGATLYEVIDIKEEKLWVYITYWRDNSEPILNIFKQNNPIGID